MKTISNGIYINKSLKLKYTPVGNMDVDNDKELKDLSYNLTTFWPDELKEIFSDIGVDFHGVVIKNYSSFYILASKLVDKNISKEKILKELLDENSIKVQPHKLGDVKFSKASRIDSNDMHRTYLVKKSEDYCAIIWIKATSDEITNRFLSGFSKPEG